MREKYECNRQDCWLESPHAHSTHDSPSLDVDGTAKADTRTPEQYEEDYQKFVVRDSGQRQSFESGMVRDVTDDKIDYTLALDGPMFKRLAVHLTEGAKKYAKRNWMLAAGEEELERFRESALRHFLQWYWGDVDEDHAAAVLFNINGAEFVKERLEDDRPN